MFREGSTSVNGSPDQSQQLPENEIYQLRLIDLHYGGSMDIPYKKGDLEDAIKLCPSVASVKISWDDTFSDEDLKPLCKLKNLRHLYLLSTERLTFKGLLPILQKFGPSTLEKLQLKWLPEVDISAIAQHCSNLRSLTLDCNFRYLSPTRPLKPAHNRLRSLERLEVVQCDEENTPPAADLFILLSSPALASLNFYQIESAFDQVMEEVARLYRFPNLRELQFTNCGKTSTERSIECLLKLDNPLEKILFRGGWRTKPKKQLLKKWEREVKKNNWNLSIQTD